jgi:phage-related protein
MNDLPIMLVKEGAKFTIWAVDAGGGYGFANFADKYSKDDKKDWSRLMRRIDRFSEDGPSSDRRHYNVLDPPIFEIKTLNGLRAPYFYQPGNIIIITSGFLKKGNKTPPNQIKIAKRRMKNFKDALASDRLTCIIPHDQSEPRRIPQ